MTRWSVPLAGGYYDLRFLAECQFGDADVTWSESETLLTSPIFEPLQQAGDVFRSAQRVLSRMNNVGRLGDQRYRWVQLNDTVFDDSAPKRKTTKLVRAEFRSGSKLTAVINGGVPGPTLAERAYALAPTHKALEDALRAFGAADWVGWYKVVEILEDERVDAVAEDCVTASELNRLTWTANHPDAAGDGARHARMNTDPPPEPHMSELEGQGVAGRLIECLVRHFEQQGAPRTSSDRKTHL